MSTELRVLVLGRNWYGNDVFRWDQICFASCASGIDGIVGSY